VGGGKSPNSKPRDHGLAPKGVNTEKQKGGSREDESWGSTTCTETGKGAPVLGKPDPDRATPRRGGPEGVVGQKASWAQEDEQIQAVPRRDTRRTVAPRRNLVGGGKQKRKGNGERDNKSREFEGKTSIQGTGT